VKRCSSTLSRVGPAHFCPATNPCPESELDLHILDGVFDSIFYIFHLQINLKDLVGLDNKFTAGKKVIKSH
jgi:hypothetical protein